MKAVCVLEKGKVGIVNDAPEPVIGDYQALCRIQVCGFCNGTDIRIIDELVGPHQLLQPYPTLLGHESAGTVLETGPKVRYIKEGEKHLFIMGTNSLAGSKYTSTHAQMAQYGILTDTRAMREDGLEIPPGAVDAPSLLPDDFDLVDGGVMLPLCECLSAVRNFGISGDTDVLIFGAGPMGLAIMRYMHLLGAKSVTAVDSVPERLEKAKSLGMVGRVINFREEDVAAALSGRLFDRVIDAVGLSSVIREASAYLKPFGVVCSLGVLHADDAAVDLSKLKNNTLVHMLNFPYREHQCLGENLEYIRKGLIDPKDFYSHVLPMEEVGEAIRLVRAKEAIKVILTID